MFFPKSNHTMVASMVKGMVNLYACATFSNSWYGENLEGTPVDIAIVFIQTHIL
jgi:hypothetical protein